MPRLDPTFEIAGSSSDPWTNSFFRLFRNKWTQLVTLLNGQIGIGNGTTIDNINGVWVTVTTTQANFVVTHNLGRVPVGWQIWSKNGFEDLKFISSTTTTLTLAGLNGGVSVLLFIS